MALGAAVQLIGAELTIRDGSGAVIGSNSITGITLSDIEVRNCGGWWWCP